MLPPEVTDKIIDYLHDDKKTLSSCARVARSWVPRSQVYLWRNITLDGSKNPTALSPDILHGSPGLGMLQHLKLAYLEEPLMEDIVLHLPSLPSLHTLVLITCYFPRRSHPATLSTSVRRLVVSRQAVQGMSSWHNFVTAFPSLQELALGEMVQILEWTPEPPPPMALSLQRLELVQSELDSAICSWLKYAVASVTTVRVSADIVMAVVCHEPHLLASNFLRTAERLEVEARCTYPREISASACLLSPEHCFGHTDDFEFTVQAPNTYLAMFMIRMSKTLRAVTVDAEMDDVFGYLCAPYQQRSRPLDLFAVVFHRGTQDTAGVGVGWTESAEMLGLLMSMQDTTKVGALVLRAAHPAAWDACLLEGAASMRGILPLRLEQQDEDGTVRQVHWK